MILYPMIISAVAVLATLVYASYLDIKDRRVPFRTWIPMLIIGIPSTIWLLFDTTANFSLIAGYLALVAAFFYANYLDSREETNPVKFQYLAVVTWSFRRFPGLSSQRPLFFHLFPGMACLPEFLRTLPTKNTKNRVRRRQSRRKRCSRQISVTR